MEKHWLSVEKLVHLIEKSISPDSKVEHNIKLPDLTSTNKRLRQCDIVVTSGNPKRPTITIIEVQDRNSKLNLNTFQGFVQKMKDVGAQHLICVSIKGFSKTIIEKARNSGGTIRLVTLDKFEPESFPIELPSLTVEHYMSHLEINELPKISFTTKTEISIQLKEMLFEIPQLVKTFNYINLGDFFISNIIKPEKDGETTISLPNFLFDLNILHKGERYKVDSFNWKIHFKVTKHLIPVYGYTYNQIDTGAMAWLLESCSELAGRTRIVRMPLILQEDGKFKASVDITK